MKRRPYGVRARAIYGRIGVLSQRIVDGHFFLLAGLPAVGRTWVMMPQRSVELTQEKFDELRQGMRRRSEHREPVGDERGA